MTRIYVTARVPNPAGVTLTGKTVFITRAAAVPTARVQCAVIHLDVTIVARVERWTRARVVAGCVNTRGLHSTWQYYTLVNIRLTKWACNMKREMYMIIRDL